jgi:hypothetical protein
MGGGGELYKFSKSIEMINRNEVRLILKITAMKWSVYVLKSSPFLATLLCDFIKKNVRKRGE